MTTPNEKERDCVLKYPDRFYKAATPLRPAHGGLRRVKMQKALKTYMCISAEPDHHAIYKGEYYRHESYEMTFGYFVTYRMCLRCTENHMAQYPFFPLREPK